MQHFEKFKNLLLTALFILASIGIQAQNCDVTEIEILEGPYCLSADTYGVCFLVKGENLPAQPSDDLKIVIGHQPRTVSSYQLTGDGLILCVDHIPNRGDMDVEVFIQVERGCTKTARALFDEPDCGNTGDDDDDDDDDDDGEVIDDDDECDITGIFLVHTQPLFDENNTYILCILFTANDLPQGPFGLMDKIVINTGEAEYKFFDYPYHFQGIGPDGQEIYRWCVQLPCGTGEDVTVFFAAEDGACTWTERNTYNEPGEPGCRSEEEVLRQGREGTNSLLDNFPNPFNGQTEIQFTVGSRSNVRLSIVNMMGQEVARLVDGQREAGLHSVQWNGNSQNGAKVAAGTYFYRIEIGDAFVETKKLVLVR